MAYCGKDCQKAHWKANHKQHCVAKADRAPQQPKRPEDFKGADSDTAGKGKTCTICLDPLVGENLCCTLPCTHVFHSSCVADLRKFGVQQVCPLCRVPLPSGLAKAFEDVTLRFMGIRQLVETGRASWSRLPEWAQREVDAAIAGWRAAAKEGFTSALINLGEAFEVGCGVAQSTKEAVYWYRKAADQGRSEAQWKLGVLFQYGLGVAQSDKEAAHWYRKAADQGLSEAQCNLGTLFQEGVGVAQSDKEAVQWYRKAADQGCANAQCNLGVMAAKGRGVAQNLKEAAQWYSKAADQEHTLAQYYLGIMYLDGQGVARSDTEAAKLIRKAADQGRSEAQ